MCRLNTLVSCYAWMDAAGSTGSVHLRPTFYDAFRKSLHPQVCVCSAVAECDIHTFYFHTRRIRSQEKGVLGPNTVLSAKVTDSSAF